MALVEDGSSHSDPSKALSGDAAKKTQFLTITEMLERERERERNRAGIQKDP